MHRLPNSTNPAEFNQVEREILGTETPENSFSRQIIHRIEEKERSSLRVRRGFVRKTGITAAVLASVILFGTFLSPAMAKVIQNLPLSEHVRMFVAQLGLNSENIFSQASFENIPDEEFKYQLLHMWNEAFQTNSDQVDHIRFFHPSESEIIVQMSDETGALYISNGQWTHAKQRVEEHEVPESVKTAADQAMDKVGDLGDSIRSVEQKILQPGHKPMYTFWYATKQGTIEMDVEEGTNRIIRLFAEPLSERFYKINSADDRRLLVEKTKDLELSRLQKKAMEQAKVWMNLDLSDYEVIRPDSPFNMLKFTKDGFPTVNASFTSEAVFYYFEIQ
ncbi:MAG: hypothetical protein IKE29_09760 [Paenibacillus sp.]|uniref:DUF4179 domain-containing protein n=1 Tax=Paenibacillus sp. TaxID=58172 RepID=UPI0025D6E4B9|nr:DUF4179 domain-containing protein [Paenibacillus sp.]MBR2564898.1 hypothetical protein [Paenibacillus sp.]